MIDLTELRSRQDVVAYFCMEYGLDPRLPLYAGGLGILAGDTLKAAHDARLPMIGVGIFWGEGYTVQRLDDHGAPRDAWVPVSRRALRPTGVDVMIRVRGVPIRVGAWLVTAYDNAPLLLLEPHDAPHRWLSAKLYGGSHDDRICQELLLGVGGVRVLEALGIQPAVYHFNEGHALFAGVELIRRAMVEGAAFDDALAKVRQRVAFTTHTPVPAGNAVYPLDALVHHGAAEHPLTREHLHAIGGDPFEMTPAALRLSCRANAVAQLHGRTAQGMWSHVPDRAPIASITNGVHMPTWQDPEIRAAVAQDLSDEVLWSAHQANKQTLLDEIARRNDVHLPPDSLVIGFARRKATYKRADLLLRDLDWLEPYLKAGDISLVYSGKAHPRDEGGKDLIRAIYEASRRFPHRIVFLDDYDMTLGALLTRGCDVWLNNPRRPMEASGTSGMKAAANGLLNVSVLDGWWDEGCDHGINGWQFGDGHNATSDPDDERDLRALQAVLADQVIPTWKDDRPRWLRMMRAAVRSVQVRFSAARMLEHYQEHLYRPILEARG